MSRRAKKGKSRQQGNHTPILIGIAAAFAGFVLFIVFKSTVSGEKNHAVLPYAQYTDGGSKSLVGNTYQVLGTIKSSEENKGETVLGISYEGSTKESKLLVLWISPEVRQANSHFNLNLDSSYKFIVKVEKNGYLQVQSFMTK